MALTIDTHARIPTSASSTIATSASVTYTCGSSAGVLIVVPVWAGTTARAGGDPTYAGSSLSQMFTQKYVTETSIEYWYMLSPPSGVPLTVNVPNTGGRTMWVYIISGNSSSGSITYDIDSSGSNATTAASPNVSLTTITAPTIIFAVVGTGDNTWLPTGRTGTPIHDDDIGSYGSGAQYYVKTNTGAQTITWTEGTSDDYESIAVAFKEITRSFTFVSATATQAQISENVTLTAHVPNFTLVMQDGIHSQSAENTIIVYHEPVYQLVVNNTEHIQSSDNIILTQNYIIFVINSEHLQDTSGITLSSHYSIIVKNTEQLQNSDNTVLVYHEPSYQVITSNTEHTHTSDNIILTQNYIIFVINSDHFQNTDDIILYSHYNIVVQKAEQLQVADNIIITYHQFTASLIIEDISHLQSANNIVLEARYEIIVQNANQPQLSDNIILIQNYVLVVMIASHLMNSSLIIIVGAGIVTKTMHYNRLRRK